MFGMISWIKFLVIDLSHLSRPFYQKYNKLQAMRPYYDKNKRMNNEPLHTHVLNGK
jgi:hypothetical protein